MECKYSGGSDSDIMIDVLISTYWNVNLSIAQEYEQATDSFNLNLLECKFRKHGMYATDELRFNLNLLECKWRRSVCWFVWRWRFNLNLLECKFYLADNATTPTHVLISTYWNVNFAYSITDRIIDLSFNLNLLECK